MVTRLLVQISSYPLFVLDFPIRVGWPESSGHHIGSRSAVMRHLVGEEPIEHVDVCVVARVISRLSHHQLGR